MVTFVLIFCGCGWGVVYTYA